MHEVCWCQRWVAWLFALFLTYKEIDLISLLSSLRTKGSSARHTRAVDDRQSPTMGLGKDFQRKKMDSRAQTAVTRKRNEILQSNIGLFGPFVAMAEQNTMQKMPT